MNAPREYRYTLTRDLGELDLIDVPLCWVMLNPSTADETVDDPTIRRVKSFTRAAGYRRLIVVNLFALRATDPKRLLTHSDPTGPDNEAAIRDALARSARVVCAWGSWLATHSGAGRLVRPSVVTWAREMGHRPMCLGKTKHGLPRHPLYVRGDAAFEAYP